MEALTADLDERELASEAATLLASMPPRSTAPAAVERVTYRPCPVCREVMNRHNYREISGIILHRCAGHGTWLDGRNTEGFLSVLAEQRLGQVEARFAADKQARAARATVDMEAERVMADWRVRGEPDEGQGDAERVFRTVAGVLRMLLGVFR